jgi:hypothetical protein
MAYSELVEKRVHSEKYDGNTENNFYCVGIWEE